MTARAAYRGDAPDRWGHGFLSRHASVRGMAMGQATGVAAAMALKGDLRFHDVSGEALVEKLARQGVGGIAGRKLGAMQE